MAFLSGLLLIIIIIIDFFLFLTLSLPDCKYFSSLNGGPYFPIDVCTQYQFFDGTAGSYKYQCLNDDIVAHYWTDSRKCDGEKEYYSDSYHTENKQCHGEICNHVRFRSYQQLYPNQDLCKKNNPKYFAEYALVTDCWNTINNTQQSWSLSCNDDSLTLNKYGSSHCDASEPERTESIKSGCQWFLNGTFSDNKTIPFINKTISFSGNDTYFEITCGGSTNLLWLYLVVPVGIFCCVCCFCAVIFKQIKKKSKPLQSGYVQTYV